MELSATTEARGLGAEWVPPGMRAPVLGFEVLGGHQRWALEERGRGRPKEGAPGEEDLEDQTLPRDRCCEEEIPKRGGGHSGVGIPGPGKL